MKIIQASEISERLQLHERGILELEDVYFRGNLVLAKACHLKFCFNDTNGDASSSFGNVFVQACGVTVEGLRLTGSVQLEDSMGQFQILDSIIRGSVRVGASCKQVSITQSVISSERGLVGLSATNGAELTLQTCQIEGCVSGIALMQHATIGCISDSSTWLTCVVSDSVFVGNSVDILLDVYIHGGDIDSQKTSIPIDSVISIINCKEMAVNVSFRGIFDTPIQYNQWPLPRAEFPRSVPRRGNILSGRMCTISFDDNNLIVNQDLPNSNPPTPRTRKRKQPEHPPQSKASIYYSRVLEVEPGASKADILTSYRRLALRYHPDKNSVDGDKFILIKRARDELIRMLDA
jgi:hypothetical protein